jgi:poly-gamma-glutamate synthesis protein (capsule biosynthesis protein)
MKKCNIKFVPLMIAFMITLLIVSCLYVAHYCNKNSVNNDYVVDENDYYEPKEKRMSIAMVGDALLHSSVYNSVSNGDGTYNFLPIFTDIEELIKDYDLKYYNQETIIGGKNLGLSSYPTFNSPDEIGENLVSIGFNMVSLANNHTMDKGEKGIIYSSNFWKNQEGVITAGSYSSYEDRNNILVYETNGIKYAFLSYTTGTNGITVPSDKTYLVNVYSDEQAKADIEQVKDKVDVIIVAMHWGNEYTFTPTSSQKGIAKYLSSLGVNLIIGAHPHVIEPIDYIDNTLVIYSLGNFISGQKPLGIDKIIGLFVGVDIVVDDVGNVSFDNLNYELLYTYCTDNYKNFKVIPFSKLTDDILPNYQSIEEEYRKIVENEVIYD